MAAIGKHRLRLLPSRSSPSTPTTSSACRSRSRTSDVKLDRLARRPLRRRGRRVGAVGRGHRGDVLARELPRDRAGRRGRGGGGALEVAARTPGPFYIRTDRPKHARALHRTAHASCSAAPTMLRDGSATSRSSPTASWWSAPSTPPRSSPPTGISARVLNMATIRPLDVDALVRAAADTGAIVVAEEHLDALRARRDVPRRRSPRARPVPMEFVGVAGSLRRVRACGTKCSRSVGLTTENDRRGCRAARRSLASPGSRASLPDLRGRDTAGHLAQFADLEVRRERVVVAVQAPVAAVHPDQPRAPAAHAPRPRRRYGLSPMYTAPPRRHAERVEGES